MTAIHTNSWSESPCSVWFMPKSAVDVTNNMHNNDSHLNFCTKGLTNQLEN